ncbi:MAG: J domain-containing protein [Akkermansiaceae bacterium]
MSFIKLFVKRASHFHHSWFKPIIEPLCCIIALVLVIYHTVTCGWDGYEKGGGPIVLSFWTIVGIVKGFLKGVLIAIAVNLIALIVIFLSVYLVFFCLSIRDQVMTPALIKRKKSLIETFDALWSEVDQEKDIHEREHINFPDRKLLTEIADSLVTVKTAFEETDLLKLEDFKIILEEHSSRFESLKARRIASTARAPEIKAQWEKLLSYGSRLIEEGRSLEVSGGDIRDLSELLDAIKQEGQNRLNREDLLGLEEILAPARESLAEHDRLEKLLAHMGLDRGDLSKPNIKSAYRKMAKKFHPDMGTEKDSQKMANLNEANELLSQFIKYQAR